MELISHWTIISVVLWIAGILFSYARVIVGKIGIMKIMRDTRVIEKKNVIETLEYFSKKLGIERKVQVLTSFSCRVPFTYRTIKPVILLPSDATKWPEERLRSVLVHELAHVKRIDSLTLLFARIVCSLFWFNPIVWIAYRHLHIEQEKSCDEYVVHSGIEAARYVRHVLNVVRFARRRVFLTGIFFLRGKGKMLEKRILHLLKPDALKFFTRRKFFITTVALCFCLLAPILVFNPMFAEDVKDNISKKDFWTALSGTWVNTDYLGTWEFYEQKLIVYPDGKFEYYPFTTDTVPTRQAHFTLTEAWVDPEGVMWHKGIYKGPLQFYVLGKIDKSRNTWEIVADGIDNPTEWDTSKTRYQEYEIRHRQ
jgi:beta-lactamase regulating signal transducer with metallopeptidase domain